jgi:hypothetical protein
VIARGLIGDPGLETRTGALRVIALVILAVIPVVLRVPNAVRGPPLIVDMDVVVLLGVERLLLVFRIVLVAPIILRGARIAVIPGAIHFAVIEASIGVVVLGVLAALIRTRLPRPEKPQASLPPTTPRAPSTFSTFSPSSEVPTQVLFPTF